MEAGGGVGPGAGAGAGGVGVGVVTRPCCSTVKGNPAIDNVAFLAAPGFAVTVNLTAALPLPDGFSTLNQSAPPAADQPQPDGAERLTDPAPPEDGAA
jgi:hypothetical protein